MNTELPAHTQSSFAYWTHVLWKRLFYLIVGIIGVVGSDSLDVLSPKIFQWLVDYLSQKKIFWGYAYLSTLAPWNPVLWCVALYFACTVMQMISRIIWRYTLARQSHVVGIDMKQLMWRKILNMPIYRIRSDLNVGELMNMAASDVATARMTMGFHFVGLVDFLFIFIASLFCLFSINTRLTLIALSIWPVLPFLLYKLSVKENYFHDLAQKKLGVLSDLCASAVSSIRLQRVSSSGAYTTSKMIGVAEEYRRARNEVSKNEILFMPTSSLVPILSYGIFLCFAVPAYYRSELSLGALVAMQGYIFLIQDPLSELGFLIIDWQKGFTSLGRITKFWSEKEISKEKNSVNSEKTKAVFEIDVDHFSFFEKSENTVPVTIHEKIFVGEKVGIIGKIGSGKTTLLNALAGLDSILVHGEIRFFGEKIQDIPASEFRKYVSFVPQKPYLFADTVRNNVSLQNKLSDDEIWKLLELVEIKKEMEALPQGLDSSLGEMGINLSGGQKQRLCLARSLAANHPVLILDDPLSAVDVVTEDKILRNIKNFLVGKTIIWAAHRDSHKKVLDRLIVL